MKILDKLKKKFGGARLAKTEKKPLTRKEKIRLAVILILVILLALLLVGFALYRSWAKPPDLPVQSKPPVVTPSETVPPSDNAGGNKDEEDKWVVQGGPIMEGERKKNFYTFLFIGRDTGGGGNTDTIMLGAYDIENQTVNIMSIPRDTMVNVPWEIKRINSVYNIYGGGERGINALYAEVSQLIGFVPDYEIIIEWKAVGELVDAIGGVWFDVPVNMDFWDPTQKLRIDVDKGYQLLDGEAAMGVVRWRQNNDGTMYPNGDIGRIETQQAFLKAVASQCLTVDNIKNIDALAQVFYDNVQTDLTLGNLVWFAEQALLGGLKLENISFVTMPGNYAATAWSPTFRNYQSYVTPYGEEMLTLINECFNPYLEDCTMESIDIMSVNKDGSLSSSTGYVEDPVARRPPVFTTPEPKPTEDPEPSESPKPSEVPEPTESPEPSDSPQVSETPAVSESPAVSEGPAVSQTPETTPEVVVSEEPEPTAAPEVSEEPEPTPEATPAVESTSDPEPEPAPSEETTE